MARRRSLTRGPASSLAPLNRRLSRWLRHELPHLRPQVQQSAAASGADRYRKHFDAFAHLCLLLFHALSCSASLRQSYDQFAACRGLAALSGLTSGAEDESLHVSYSQSAASNTSRRAAFLSSLVPALVARVRAAGLLDAVPYPVELALQDSTFLRLSLQLSPWLPHSSRDDIPGVRTQVVYTPALDLPEGVLLTDTRTSDCGGLDQLVLDDPERLAALRGRTLAVDLGYYSHARFAKLRAAGVHFVSRIKAHVAIRPTAEQPIQALLPNWQAGRIGVQADRHIGLGSANNARGAVLDGLRQVEALVAPTAAAARQGAASVRYTLVTDRWDLEAEAVVWLYRWRWQLELFFRWLKSHLRLPRLLGASKNAVQMSVWLAIIAHLLLRLAMQALGVGRRSPQFLRRVFWALATLPLLDHACSPTPSTSVLIRQYWGRPQQAAHARTALDLSPAPFPSFVLRQAQDERKGRGGGGECTEMGRAGSCSLPPPGCA
jgi:hypothetical protein